ncbi:unnamed protein product [Paramecium pentaurelia]|uniref:B9 domain-containing protein 1 n=1 Tax=Paramecium pentaurelia TaxID=43138 RepID=A0A8S1XAI6_9CILI|nr:unnamed protein product [Paramecium pentaurelia]
MNTRNYKKDVSDQGSMKGQTNQNFGNTQPQQFQDGISRIQEEMMDPRNIQPDSMFLNFSGVLECGECEDEESLRIEYAVKYGGDDWAYLKTSNNADDAEPSGISQLSTSRNLHSRNIVWNFPFECNFQTKNIFGWPQVVVRLSGPDFMGRSVAKGYGSVHVPTQPGYHERIIRIFKPLPISGFTGFLGYLLGNTAELKNFDKVISSGEGREVTRVKSVGYVKVKFHVTLVNFDKFGYL